MLLPLVIIPLFLLLSIYCVQFWIVVPIDWCSATTICLVLYYCYLFGPHFCYCYLFGALLYQFFNFRLLLWCLLLLCCIVYVIFNFSVLVLCNRNITKIMDDSISKPINGDVDDKPNTITDNVTRDKQTSETDKKKKKLSSSNVWKFFSKIGLCEDGKERAKCNGWNKKYIVGGTKYGTSHSKHHIEKCTKSKFG